MSELSRKLNGPFADYMAIVIQDRREYADFEEWCTEHNPEAWIPFQEWLLQKYREENERLEA